MIIDPLTRLALRNSGGNGPVVLTYHALERGRRIPSWKWSVSQQQFLDHLEVLRDGGWSTCTVGELVANGMTMSGSKTAVITFDDGFANNLDALAALAEYGMQATWYIVTGAIDRQPFWPDSGRPAGRMLNAEELRRLDAAGMEIGSHGVTHVRFPKLSDTELRDELHQSKQTLEDLLGKPVDSLAYPYGAWDERCETAVRDAGYRSACTTRTGPALKDRNLYRLRRIGVVNHDSAARLARKLTLLTNEGGWPHLLGYFGKQAIRRVLPDRIRS